MNRMIGCFLMICINGGFLQGADWDPNDDTFDPSIHSVVVGDASWLGDPSPFVHLGLPRTGYTHVNQTNWEGFDPAVQISLMVPLEPGEKTPPAGGMLLLNQAQTLKFIQVFQDGVRAKSTQERFQIKTASGGRSAFAPKARVIRRGIVCCLRAPLANHPCRLMQTRQA